MKNLINLIALLMLVSVNVLTPLSYAENENFSIDLADSEDPVVEKVNEVEQPLDEEEIEDTQLSKKRDIELKDTLAPTHNGTIEYNRAKGYIELTYDNQKVRIRDKNAGATHVGANDYIILLNLAKEYYTNFRYNPCHIVPIKGTASSNEDYESEFLQRAQELLGLSEPLTCEDAQNIKEIYTANTYNQYEDLDYLASFGNYYYRGNNTGAKREDLNVDLDNGVVNVKSEVIADGFNGGKLGEKDTGWEKGNMDNPCNGIGEYLPTPDDWKNLMQIRGEIKGYGLMTGNIQSPIDVYYFDENEAMSEFVQDIWIPNAGSIQNQANFHSEGVLRTAKDGNKIGAMQYDGLDNGLIIFTDLTSLLKEDLNTIATTVRCFVYVDPVTVNFDTDNGSDIEPYKVERGSTIIPPANPTRDGYTFEGWYKDSDLTQQWNFDTDVVEDDIMTLHAKWKLCGEGFTIIGNKCISNNINTNGIIEVSDGVESYYIRDKNVGASAACSPELNQIMELYNNRCPSAAEELFEAAAESTAKIDAEASEFPLNPADFISSCIHESDLIVQVNAILDLDTPIQTISELSAYINQEVQNCRGNYYFRGNNRGASYNDFTFDPYDPNYVTNTGYLISTGFDGGRMGIPEGSGWIKGNPQDNPCNGTGEYLPTTEDWENLIRVWLNKKESNSDDFTPISNDTDIGPILIDPTDPAEYIHQISNLIPTTFPDPEMVYEFMQDMQILNAGMVRYSNCGQEYVGPEVGPLVSAAACEDGMFYNDNSFGLRTAQQDGKIGLFNDFGIFSGTVENMIDNNLNDTALSVRCFVNMDIAEVLVVTLVSDGQETREVNVVSGENLGEPSVSPRNGYTFEGWYLDSEFNSKYNFDTPVTEDITLYAKWTQNKQGGNSSGGGGGGGGSSSTKPDKTDTGVNEKDAGSSNTSDTQGDTEDSTPNTQGEDGKQDSSDRSTVQVSDSVNNGGTKGGDFTPEFREAYNYAKENGITTKSSIENANMYGNLTRIQMAKMLSNYAINVMGLKPDESRVNKFRDVTEELDAEYNNAVTLSYQLGIMGINMPNNKFRPHDYVPRAEFVAAFSRMLFKTSDGEYESTSKYYTHHMEKLKTEKIITNDNPKMIERRGYVMIMLMRSAK